MEGVDRPQCLNMRDGAQDGVAVFALLSDSLPLVVEAWMTFDDRGFGKEVSVAIANGVEALDWVRDIVWVFVVL